MWVFHSRSRSLALHRDCVKTAKTGVSASYEGVWHIQICSQRTCVWKNSSAKSHLLIMSFQNLYVFLLLWNTQGDDWQNVRAATDVHQRFSKCGGTEKLRVLMMHSNHVRKSLKEWVSVMSLHMNIMTKSQLQVGNRTLFKPTGACQWENVRCHRCSVCINSKFSEMNEIMIPLYIRLP